MPAEGAGARTPDPPARVFEAVNETLKEVYLGLSPKGTSIDDLRRRHQDAPPPHIGRWRPEHQVSYRFIEAPPRRNERYAFVHTLAITISIIGWEAVTDPALRA